MHAPTPALTPPRAFLSTQTRGSTLSHILRLARAGGGKQVPTLPPTTFGSHQPEFFMPVRAGEHADIHGRFRRRRQRRRPHCDPRHLLQITLALVRATTTAAAACLLHTPTHMATPTCTQSIGAWPCMRAHRAGLHALVEA
eukprot:6178667-Pleurochrysis_carterae.AAC.1